jgi:hypothetical protein
MKWTLNTEYGTFRVEINDDTQLNYQTQTRVRKGDSLSVGGSDICVYITIPFIGDKAFFHNLKTGGSSCDVGLKKVSGKNTVGMVNLAFTIIRILYPNIRYIQLEDKSDFPCTLSNGSKIGISMALYQLIFYQKTYYEKNFGAYLKDKKLHRQYEELKCRFYEKPTTMFSFRNKDLDELFGPFLVESKTWVELFKKIHTFNNTCAYIYPWYKSAINEILNNFPIERNTWIIDLQNNPLTPMIYFSKIKNMNGGNRTKRKRTRKYLYAKMDEYPAPYDYLMYDEIYNLKYK